VVAVEDMVPLQVKMVDLVEADKGLLNLDQVIQVDLVIHHP
tara:strand:- start:275 stop:397 length:123 start_codon:yes stop_codon:yes gene_type:complete